MYVDIARSDSAGIENSVLSENTNSSIDDTGHFVEPSVFQPCGGSLIELFIRKALQAPAFSRREFPNSAVTEDTVPVLHRKGEHWLVGFFDPTALLTDGFLIGRHNGSRLVLNKHGGVFAFMLTDAAVLSGGDASSRFGELRIGVHIDKKIALRIEVTPKS